MCQSDTVHLYSVVLCWLNMSQSRSVSAYDSLIHEDVKTLARLLRHKSLVKPPLLPITKWLSLRWRHNDHDGVSNHPPHHCLLNCLFRCRSTKTSKLCVTGLCAGKSPGTGEFPAQMASNAFSIWWRHHDCRTQLTRLLRQHQAAGHPRMCFNATCEK